MFTDRRGSKERRKPARAESRRKAGAARRISERVAGVSIGWAKIQVDETQQLSCWILNESKTGAALETRDQASPCPILVGQAYWVLIKPSSSNKSKWVGGQIRHCREKTSGCGIYKIGLQINSEPPPGMGDLAKGI